VQEQVDCRSELLAQLQAWIGEPAQHGAEVQMVERDGEPCRFEVVANLSRRLPPPDPASDRLRPPKIDTETEAYDTYTRRAQRCAPIAHQHFLGRRRKQNCHGTETDLKIAPQDCAQSLAARPLIDPSAPEQRADWL
jgi:hypothetical protein